MTISRETGFTTARKSSESIYTYTVVSTWTAKTFINISAVDTVTFETDSASAFETTDSVDTSGIAVTVISSVGTFVDINADDTVTFESGIVAPCQWAQQPARQHKPPRGVVGIKLATTKSNHHIMHTK